jgi:hypothetical protein
MNITEKRRENLRRWIAANGTPEKERSLFSQLKADASFGERVARRLEEEYRMGAGYLDQDPDGPSAATTSESRQDGMDADAANDLLRRATELLETYRLADPAGRRRIDAVAQRVRGELIARDQGKVGSP